MQNDISLEDVKKDTALRQQKLQKMKKNIEALQLNMAKKKGMGSNNSNQPSQNIKHIQPITAYEQSSYDSRNKSPINHQHQYAQNQFGYDSTLYKNINNDSQPTMNNGSGVSNFSSVSNINHILNSHHLGGVKGEYDSGQGQRSNKGQEGEREKDRIMEDIDKILEKVQRSQKLPTKGLERVMNRRQNKQNRSVISEEAMSNSKYSNSSGGEVSARTKLQEYRQLINKLDTIQEQHLNRESKDSRARGAEQKNEKQYAKTFQFQEFDQEVKSSRQNEPQPSNRSYKNQFPSNYEYSNRLPPTPHSKRQNKAPPLNGVQRQKMLIKQSVLQYKLLETQSSHDVLDRSEIDFELSDDQDHKKIIQPQKQENQKVIGLLKEKKDLQMELKVIEEQLASLQRE